MNSWIRCADRLPALGEEVFFVRERAVHRGIFKGEPAPAFVSDHMIYWWPSEKVTHWIPSPTPALPAELALPSGRNFMARVDFITTLHKLSAPEAGQLLAIESTSEIVALKDVALRQQWFEVAAKISDEQKRRETEIPTRNQIREMEQNPEFDASDL